MNFHVERHKICFQCIGEDDGLSSDQVDFLLEIIRRRIKKGTEWSNPMFVNIVRTLDRDPQLWQICSGCPYKLEHVVFSKGDVDEYRR